MGDPPNNNKEGGTKPETAKASDTSSSAPVSDRLSAEEIGKRIDDALEQSKLKKKVKGSKDEDRSQIANRIVLAFLLAVGLVLVGVPIYNLYAFRHAPIAVDTRPAIQPLDLGNTLTEVGTILGPSVGFVVGFYFKDEVSKKVKKDNKD